MKKYFQSSSLCQCCGSTFSCPEKETRSEYRYAKKAIDIRCPVCKEPLIRVPVKINKVDFFLRVFNGLYMVFLALFDPDRYLSMHYGASHGVATVILIIPVVLLLYISWIRPVPIALYSSARVKLAQSDAAASQSSSRV